jgi:biopolymer transport protein ExbB/TolQ
MNVNDLAKTLGDACYGLLAINFLWGLYCIILVRRRLGRLRFPNDAAQAAFQEELQQHLAGGNPQAALNACESNERALPRLAAIAIANRQLELPQLRQLVAHVVQRDVFADIEYRLSWVATVIKSGPLLGLFGTVLGMMAAFGRIGQGEKVQPSQIADEISIALICTAMGLATAIPFSYALAALQIRVRMLHETLGFALTQLMDQLKRLGK